MNGIIAAGTFSLCLLLSIGLYRYRAFLTQIVIIGSLATWLWSMAMMAYALNNKHSLLPLAQQYFSTIVDTYLSSVLNKEQGAPQAEL